MKGYDLIVCGAGPSGAMAAATAARAGLKVALVEKYPLPRHKTCGGGMPMVVQDFLQALAPDAFVESDVQFIRHTWDFDDPHIAPINESGASGKRSLWMVQRSVFDYALVQQAVLAGVDLLDKVAVRSILVEDGCVRVSARANCDRASRNSELQLSTRYVIGADGANGVMAKAAGLRQNQAIALGMEVEFPHQWGGGHSDLRSDIVHLEYGAIRHGYAWVFPKADHINVGAGVFNLRGKDARSDRDLPLKLRQTILRYLDSLRLAYDPAHLKFHAHPLPLWNGREQIHTLDGKVLLAGDAAGLINPFFGDGILHAVKSGRIAAQCVIEGTTQQYSDRIHQEFAANFDAARLLAKLFYQFPHFWYRYGVKHPVATRAAVQLLAGELSFDKIGQRVAQRLLQRIVGKDLISC